MQNTGQVGQAPDSHARQIGRWLRRSAFLWLLAIAGGIIYVLIITGSPGVVPDDHEVVAMELQGDIPYITWEGLHVRPISPMHSHIWNDGAGDTLEARRQDKIDMGTTRYQMLREWCLQDETYLDEHEATWLATPSSLVTPEAIPSLDASIL